MRLKLQTISELSDVFGGTEAEIDFEKTTVAELAACLKERYKLDLTERGYLMIFVNGKGCVDFGKRLKDGDHVAIVPILAAG
jgi:molybdopterin converting factor small subunit